MPKNIILCSDGTGNRGGVGRGTNVWRLYKSLDLHNDRTRQYAFYNDGVGTEDFRLFKILGGAFGWGLSRNVQELYAFLVRHYETGDRIYLFGFSRGAFTVRSLAGLVMRCGIADRQNCNSPDLLRTRVAQAFRAYRSRSTVDQDYFRQQWAVEDPEHAPDGCVKIHFIGVWDTVDAVGVPFDEIREWLNKISPYGFHDYRLNPRVINAYHALSIDDARHTFLPVMWDEKELAQDQTVEQVWFTGVHSNVGGGYPKDEVSLVPLNWMMERAQEKGLVFLQDPRKQFREQADVHGKVYDSRSGLAGYYRYMARDVGRISRQHHIEKPRIHASAFERISRFTADYAPGNLPADYAIAPAASPIVRELGGTKRRSELDRFWDFVWLRRWLYYLILFVTLTLILPVVLDPEEECTARFCLDTPPLKLVKPLIPEFVQPALESYSERPQWLLLVLLLLGLLWVRQRIKWTSLNLCTSAWRKSLGQPSAAPRVSPWESGLARFAHARRTSTFALQWMPWIKENAIPWVITLGITALLVYLWKTSLLWQVATLPLFVFVVGQLCLTRLAQWSLGNEWCDFSFRVEGRVLHRRWGTCTKDEVAKQFEAMQEDGRNAYKCALEWDMLFPFFYGTAFLVALIAAGALWPNAPWISYATRGLFLIVLVADLTENFILLTQLSRYENSGEAGLQPERICIGNLATQVKLFLVIILSGMCIYAFLGGIYPSLLKWLQ